MKVHENLKVGQVWRSNDSREIRAVRIISLGNTHAVCENVLTGVRTVIKRDSFRTGSRGFSLDKDIR